MCRAKRGYGENHDASFVSAAFWRLKAATSGTQYPRLALTLCFVLFCRIDVGIDLNYIREDAEYLELQLLSFF